ncbi:MAG: glycosyltransferase [Ruminococcaceae bacterium]|nr:glycosyltransferase [Oscillospiraceae bacterium]
MNIPKISIIIPIHNTEKYIEQCLESAVNQSLKDIEIICVDDCSTDKSVNIINQYVNKYSNVQLIALNTKGSALVARKKGVEASTGEYIMFLDADDYLSNNACEKLYSKIIEEKADILNFSSKVINCANLPEYKIKGAQCFLKPYIGRLENENIFKGCFVDGLYGHNLWSKIYKSALCKKAFNEIEEIYMPFAEDLYTYFVISYYAKSYYGWNSPDLYYYCYGRGISGKQHYSVERFEKLCHHSVTVKALKNFCQGKEEAGYSLTSIVDGLYNEWINDCIGVWYADINKKDSQQALKLMFKYWGVAEVTSLFAKRFWNKRTEIADKIGRFDITPLEQREIKTVAFYYYCYSVGGVERVLSLVMPMFVKMGYKVILVTDKPETENDFMLPEGVERCVLFDKDAVTGDNFSNRAESWEKVIKEKNIDIVLYNFWRSHLYLWDLLYLKGMDIPTVVVAHGVFSLALTEYHKNFAEHTKTFALADAMTTLSYVDKLFWETYVDKVYYMPNPVSKELFDADKCKWENNAVIWMGRTTPEKNPQAPFEIMKRVVVHQPDAKLYLLGDFDDPHWQTIADEYGLKNNIVFTGFVSDVSEYLKNASVHLMTSNFEGFPMALVEAKAHSMPTVMFGMPHIMLGKKECGTIGVDMHDYDSAAKEIVYLLQDKNYWEENSILAKQAVEDLKNFDFETQWRNIIKGAVPPKISNDLTERFVKTVVNHYDLGAKDALIKQAYTNQRKSIAGKIKGGLDCIKEKGLVYTIKLALKH